MISYFARWAGLAAASLHDQASGTLMTRPSARWAVILSSVTSTRLILASLLAAVLIPCLQNPAQVFFNIRLSARARTCTPCARDGRARASAHSSRSCRKRSGRDPGCPGLVALIDYTARLTARECPLFDTVVSPRRSRAADTPDPPGAGHGHLRHADPSRARGGDGDAEPAGAGPRAPGDRHRQHGDAHDGPATHAHRGVRRVPARAGRPAARRDGGLPLPRPRSSHLGLEPKIPLYVSGFGPRAMELAGKHGDGSSSPSRPAASPSPTRSV